jgi:RNA polymerase sporulation-specific sigma factor
LLVARLSASSQSQVQVDDGYLIALAKQGDPTAYDRLVRRYYGFVRLKASSYFLAGGDADDLIQEGLVGLYKAIRDYRTDRESSFRNFAELCITRQIITAVKTATRNKHVPLNQYVSFASTPAGASGDGEPTLDEILPGATVHDPVNQVISSEELRALVGCLSTTLSELESRVLSLYLDGRSYEGIGEIVGCDTKTVDNALQRVKRKIGVHLGARNVLL